MTRHPDLPHGGHRVARSTADLPDPVGLPPWTTAHAGAASPLRHVLGVLPADVADPRVTRTAARLARRERAALTLVQVRRRWPTEWCVAEGGVELRAAQAVADSAAERLLAEAVDEVPSDVPVSTATLSGVRYPTKRLLAYGATHHVDLVVMSPHDGRRVAQLRAGRIPVLVVADERGAIAPPGAPEPERRA